MIDGQLTTEIFSLFAPSNAQVGLTLARLPIRTVASEAAAIAEFYAGMHALASVVDQSLLWLSKPDGSLSRHGSIFPPTAMPQICTILSGINIKE